MKKTSKAPDAAIATVMLLQEIPLPEIEVYILLKR